MQYGVSRLKPHKFMQFSHYIGVDISKMTLDMAIYPARDLKADCLHITNDDKGLRDFLSWLKNKGLDPRSALICAEHTGIYSKTLEAFVQKKELNLSMNSPLNMKRSMGIARGKNDKLDAIRIAEYAYLHRESLKIYQKPSDLIIQLQYLLAERRQYTKQKTAITNMHTELGRYETAAARTREKNTIRRMDEMLRNIDAQIVELISTDPAVSKNYNLISSIKGIGLVNAVSTIVYTNNFQSFETPRQYACYIGVAPFEHSSGTSVHGRTQVSKICRTQQKTELTMAARTSIVHDPWMRKYYLRKMKEKGGAREMHGVVLNAVKFKLILRMFAVVRSGQPYKILNY